MYSSCYIYYLFIYKANKVQKSKNRFVRADMLFAELASDFGGELVVGGGPFREPPTVMQSTVIKIFICGFLLYPPRSEGLRTFYFQALEIQTLKIYDFSPYLSLLSFYRI